MSFDRRAPGTAVIRPTTDGRWRIAFDETAAMVVDTQRQALALVPSDWSFVLDPEPGPPDGPWTAD